MISKSIACLLASISLSGCCTVESYCNGPLAASPAASDGLNEPVQDEIPKNTPTRRKKVPVTAQTNRDSQSTVWPQTNGEREQQEVAAAQAEDARLKRKLRICNGCSTTPEKAAEATDGSSR
jgi:hypothetical protein